MIILCTILFLKIVSNIKMLGIAICIFLFSTLKANNSIVLHFYDESNEQEADNDCNKEDGRHFSRFVKQRYSCFEHKKCVDCTKYIITNRNRFPLSLETNNEEEKVINIYIRLNLLKYTDFLYFLKCLKYIHDIKEDLQVADCVLLIHILDIFKFKKDEIFNQFVRMILLSTTLNNENNCVNCDLVKKINTSLSVFKSIIYEFCKIYLFNVESLFEEITKKNIRSKIMNEDLNENFYSSKDFFHFSSKSLDKIGECMRHNCGFLVAVEKIFGKIQPLRVALYSSQSNNDILDLLSLKFCGYCEELCFYAWLNIDSMESILENIIFESVKRLFFYFCRFSSFSENRFKNFPALENIYIFRCFFKSTIISHKIFNFTQNLVSIFNNEMKIEQFSKYLDLNAKIPCQIEALDVKKIILENKQSLSQEAFDCKKYQIHFSYLILFKSSVTFKLSILNLGKTEKISLFFDRVHIDKLNFQSLDISKNIRCVNISNSELTDGFLSNILLFPSLKRIRLVESNLKFRKNVRNYVDHLLMHELLITGCRIENENGIFVFINSMPNIKKLSFYSNKNASFGLKIFKNNGIKLDDLEFFHFGEVGKYIADYSNFTSLNSIIVLKLIVASKAGSLRDLFFNKRFKNLKWLVINSFKIESIDKKSLVNCMKLSGLAMYNSECKIIHFSELFDRKKEYSLEKIILQNIPIKNQDIIFLSNLKHLKALGLYGTHLSFNVIYFFRLFQESFFKQKKRLYFDKEFLLHESINHFKEISGIDIEYRMVWLETPKYFVNKI